MPSKLLFSLGLASELSGIGYLFYAGEKLQALILYAFAHGVASAAFTVILIALLPVRYRQRTTRAALFLFSLQFAIPFVGSPGVFVGILLALYLPRTVRNPAWQSVLIPELPYTPIDMDTQTVYTEGGLRQVLREAGDMGKRVRALLATRQMPGKEGIEILREALKDSADDVRLLAYSLLEQREKHLVTEAGNIQEELKNRPDEAQEIVLYRRLAQLWWETAYLGLAQGSLRRYYLQNSRDLLIRLVGKVDQHVDWQLLGRVELALGNIRTAGEAFEIAMENGARKEQVYPYLAEVAFLERDFEKVRYCLARCAHGPSHPAISPLLEAWL
ncbi:MAG: polysaccharide biosynthesis protein [Pseudomonadota bacterium]